MIVVMTTISDPMQRAFARGDLIDITTTGRHSGQARRIEIVYHVIDGRIYISGTPTPAATHSGRSPKLTR